MRSLTAVILLALACSLVQAQQPTAPTPQIDPALLALLQRHADNQQVLIAHLMQQNERLLAALLGKTTVQPVAPAPVPAVKPVPVPPLPVPQRTTVTPTAAQREEMEGIKTELEKLKAEWEQIMKLRKAQQ